MCSWAGRDNAREKNPCWVQLRRLTKELGVDTWKKFHQYLKKGNINPRVLTVLKRMAEIPWKDDELTHPLKYYYQLHPEEKEGSHEEQVVKNLKELGYMDETGCE